MMHKVNNYMIQGERGHMDLQTWLDHFETVCREQGLEVERMVGGTMSVKTTAGSDVDAMCKEATRRCSAHKDDAPPTREEYDKEVDRKEDLRDLDASRRTHREYLKTVAEEALRLAKAERHVPFMLAWASVIASIEKDLI